MSDFFTDAVVKAVKAAQEAADLSEVLQAPSQGESLADLHQRLIETRARHTRLSEIVGTLVRIQGAVRKDLIDKKGELLDAEAGVVTEKRVASFNEDYSSAQERNARLASKTLEQRIALRKTEKLAEDVNSALEYARIKHRELGSQTSDVNTRIRIITLEGNWD